MMDWIKLDDYGFSSILYVKILTLGEKNAGSSYVILTQPRTTDV